MGSVDPYTDDHLDEIELASDASFPASDPPPWTPTKAGHPERQADREAGAAHALTKKTETERLNADEKDDDDK